MTYTQTNYFVPYAAGGLDSSGQQDIAKNAFLFSVSVGGGPVQQLEMDTGSTGVVVDASYITTSTPLPSSYGTIPTPSYSSSGSSYTGTWVLATLEFQNADGTSFTTAEIPVFAANVPDSTKPVKMMGVAVCVVPGASSELNTNAWNPFLNLEAMVSGALSKSYIVSRTGVTFGIDATTEATFQLFQGLTPTGSVSVTAQGAATPAYTANLPLLLDTGINYTIVAPLSGSPVPTTLLQTGGEQFNSDLTISIGFWGNIASWSYSTTDCGSPSLPALARSVKPGQPSIINTGRTVFATYDYLADVTNNVVGIRLTTT